MRDPRRDANAPGGCRELRAFGKRGRRECRVFVAPAALRASEESTQASHHRYAETVRHSLHDGLAAYTRSPRSAGLVSLRRWQIIFRQLDASVGASGPRDFAVCMDLRSSDAAHTSIAPRLTFRDDWP